MHADCFSGPGKAVDLLVCVCVFAYSNNIMIYYASWQHKLKEMNKTYTKKSRQNTRK